MSHGVVCKYHYRENFRVWLTSVTVWLFFREGVAKCPCKCGSVSEIYIPYTKADLNWMDKSSRSSVEMSDHSSRPEIMSVSGNMEEYDTIFVGFPIIIPFY